MNQHHHFWSFKSKDERRAENDQEKHRQERIEKVRTDGIAVHTHLDLQGRKGFVGLVRSMPAFLRHRGNQLYARWISGGGE